MTLKFDVEFLYCLDCVFLQLLLKSDNICIFICTILVLVEILVNIFFYFPFNFSKIIFISCLSPIVTMYVDFSTKSGLKFYNFKV
jgi:hypothetical protein